MSDRVEEILNFLYARILEDFDDGYSAHRVPQDGDGPSWSGRRIVNETAAKREVIMRVKDLCDGLNVLDKDSREIVFRHVIAPLVRPYSNHPDFKWEWTWL